VTDLVLAVVVGGTMVLAIMVNIIFVIGWFKHRRRLHQ
jgi:hypothetical protein